MGRGEGHGGRRGGEAREKRWGLEKKRWPHDAEKGGGVCMRERYDCVSLCVCVGV